MYRIIIHGNISFIQSDIIQRWIREKSHYCIARYMEKYVENDSLEEEWVTLLDRMREIRHMDNTPFNIVQHTKKQLCYRLAKKICKKNENPSCLKY